MTTRNNWLLIVNVTVDEEVEESWNKWYDEEHLPEILDCPGFLSGSRYVNEVDGKRSYLTIYELEGPEAMTSNEFKERRGWYQFKERVNAKVGFFELTKSVCK